MDSNVASGAQRRVPWVRVLLPVLGILVLATGVIAYRTWSARRPGAAEPPPLAISQQTLEEQYGLHINLLAVTAAGGLIDLRFKVLDEAKAAQLLATPQLRLAIVAQENGTVIEAPPDTKQSFDLQQDMVYFVQFPNVRHAVEVGSSVALVLGGVRVEDLIAQ